MEQLQVQLQLSADRFGQTDKLFVDSESQSLTCERGGWREGGCGALGRGSTSHVKAVIQGCWQEEKGVIHSCLNEM